MTPAVYQAPTSATADKQIEIINELIDNNVDGIAISANDADALESSLTEALNSGIEVISVDAPVNSISRKTHILKPSGSTRTDFIKGV